VYPKLLGIKGLIFVVCRAAYKYADFNVTVEVSVKYASEDDFKIRNVLTM
jgi:hypothetical protein